jgi:GLPGLI family protein
LLIDGEPVVSEEEEEDVKFSIFNFRSLEKKYFLDEESALFKKTVIKDELIKPEWNIVSDSVKKIAGYECIMAKGKQCGRDFTVWFTPDIPVNCGPWKLWGLPGLIVDANSNDGYIVIQLHTLKTTTLSPQEPLVKETIHKKEFSALLKEEIKKAQRRLSVMSMERGLNVEANIAPTMLDLSLLE